MSDPNFKPEEVAPPKPPRPTAAQRQLEADEMYARQLAEHYQSSSRDQRGRYDDDDDDDRGPPLPRRNQATSPTSDEEREHSFFDGGSFLHLCPCFIALTNRTKMIYPSSGRTFARASSKHRRA